MREEKNRAAPLPDYHECGRMSADRERVLLRAILDGRAAKEQLQQHTVRLEDIADAQRAVVAGEQSREELTLSYLPLVAIIARRFSYSNVSMDDLMQEGALGLLNIIDTYKGGSLNFPAFITVGIKQAMSKLIKQKNFLNYRQLYRRLFVRLARFQSTWNGTPGMNLSRKK